MLIKKACTEICAGFFMLQFKIVIVEQFDKLAYLFSQFAAI